MLNLRKWARRRVRHHEKYAAIQLIVRQCEARFLQAEDNTLFLYDVICGSDKEAACFGGISPEVFSKTLVGMSGTVHLRISSPGGDVFGSRAMAQAMREYSGDIIAHVDGYAASAASLIAITAKKTIMAPGAFLMIHKAWTLGIGNSDDLLATAELLEKIDGTLAETYAAKGNKTVGEFADMMAQETWFTPQEALDCGLCDEIATEASTKSESTVEGSTSWDLSAFERAPHALAEQKLTKDETDQVAAVAAALETEQKEQRTRALQLLQTAA